MDVRGKLVELLEASPYLDVLGGLDCYKEAAKELIAHGVTVQEWISVNEKLPKLGEDVLVAVFDGYDTWVDMDCLMRDGKWCFETENRHISHWRPMPQPPKGE